MFITQLFCGLGDFSLWPFGLQQVAMCVISKFFPTVISVPVHDMDEPYKSSHKSSHKPSPCESTGLQARAQLNAHVAYLMSWFSVSEFGN